MIIHLITWLIKQILFYKNDYFLPYSRSKNKTGVDTSQFVKKEKKVQIT